MYILRYYCGVEQWQIEEKQVRIWRSIFRRLTTVLEKMPLEEHKLPSDDARLVELFFHFMHRIDTGGNFISNGEDDDEKERWHKTFDREKSIFRNHFILTLLRFNIEIYPFWRMKALLEMSDEERLVAATDDEMDDLAPDPETGIINFDAEEHRSLDGAVEDAKERAVEATDLGKVYLTPPSVDIIHPSSTMVQGTEFDT